TMGLFHELVGQGKTIIMVTHDLELAEKTSRTIVMRDGKIERDIELTQFNTVTI
ncbi:ABC transporter ATP-binding protein, partial [Salmonella enterica subsp. enterica serovar Enteritidis]|nr:ABC transporter ATP-binding protein [Salmonella enterica subsp. enterica serovar Enteritidis]